MSLMSILHGRQIIHWDFYGVFVGVYIDLRISQRDTFQLWLVQGYAHGIYLCSRCF